MVTMRQMLSAAEEVDRLDRRGHSTSHTRYIYVLFCADKMRPFYVGCTSQPGRRLALHISHIGKPVRMAIVERTTYKKFWEVERKWILHLRSKGLRLRNLRPGKATR